MFCIRIADVPIGIDNRYPFIYRQCKGYITDSDEPEFTVRVSEEEILEEQKGDMRFSNGYCESLCLYRKICSKLPAYGAFLMHSAVIAVDDVAYVFSAPSGVGKTTHIRLWLEQSGQRARVVNGDKPIFRFVGETLYACGTPWKGKEDMGSNIMCPVQAICFLEQSPQNHIRPLSMEEVTGRIFHQILIPKDQEDFDCFWPLLEKMMTMVDFYLLQCNRKPEAAQLAYRTMRRK